MWRASPAGGTPALRTQQEQCEGRRCAHEGTPGASYVNCRINLPCVRLAAWLRGELLSRWGHRLAGIWERLCVQAVRLDGPRPEAPTALIGTTEQSPADAASSQRRLACFTGTPASERSPAMLCDSETSTVQNLPLSVDHYT